MYAHYPNIKLRIRLYDCLVVCDPPCENGVCIAKDTCACGIGFSGRYCTELGMGASHYVYI